MHPINLIREAVSALRGKDQLKHETNTPTIQGPLDPHAFHDAVWGGEDPRDPQFFSYPVTANTQVQA